MFILYVLLVISHCAGCAYKGTVYIYSPQGKATVDKAVDANAAIDLPLLP
jgi:cbb3-type cytochrome oxidase subunit 3